VSRDDETFNTEDLIDDLIYSSNQPDYLKFRQVLYRIYI